MVPPAATSSSSTTTAGGGGGAGRNKATPSRPSSTSALHRSSPQHHQPPQQQQQHRRPPHRPTPHPPPPPQSQSQPGKFVAEPPVVLLGGFDEGGLGGGGTSSLLSDFVLAGQLPTASEALRRARESLWLERKQSGLGGGGCDDGNDGGGCRHLLAHLPDKLDVTLAQCRFPLGSNSTKTTNNTVCVPANPVHALHLASQLDSDPCLTALGRRGAEGGGAARGMRPSDAAGTTATAILTEPLLYGEEQQRLLAWQTEGVPEEWHPWIQELPPPPPQAAAAAALPPVLSSSPPSPPLKPSQIPTATPPSETTAGSTATAAETATAATTTTPHAPPADVPSSTNPEVVSSATVVPSYAPPLESVTAGGGGTGNTAEGAPSLEEQPKQQPPPSEPVDAPPPDPAPSESTVVVVVVASAPPLLLPSGAGDNDGNKKGSTPNDADLPEPPTPPKSATATAVEKEEMNAADPAAATASDSPPEVSVPPDPVPSSSSSSSELAGVPEPVQSLPSSAPEEAPIDAEADLANVPSSTEAAVAATGAPSPAPPPTASPSMEVTTAPGSTTTTTTTVAVPAVPAPTPPPHPTAPTDTTDVAYNALRAREELVRLLRRAFLAPRGGSAAAKRRAGAPPGPPNAAASTASAAPVPAHPPPKKKRKVGEAPPTTTATSKVKGPAVTAASPPPAGSAMSLSHASPAFTHPAALRNLLTLRWGGFPGEQPATARGGGAAAATTAANVVDARQWAEAREESRKQVHRWVCHFRLAREAHWRERRDRQRRQKRQHRHHHRAFHRPPLEAGMTFGVIRDDDHNDDDKAASDREDADDSDELEGWDPIESLGCVPCSSGRASEWSEWDLGRWNRGVGGTRHRRLLPRGDQVLHCLDCLFVGCAPAAARDPADGVFPKEHILQHMLTSNHNFAVTCGPQAKIYCFKCGDFVRHEIFDQEKERIDVGERFPWMGWKDHPVQRSFDALRFMRVPDQGVVWSGMFATYPPLVPPAHVRAARLSMRRQLLFQGSMAELSDDTTLGARDFAAHQSQKVEKDRFRPAAPVGMYNLGNTCFMSAILQCLVHVPDLFSYFLKEVGHNHMSCGLYKAKALTEPKVAGVLGTSATTGKVDVCLACELDKVFLQYFGSATGFDVISILRNNAAVPPAKGVLASQNTSGNSVITGEPLVTAEMLTAAWNCGGMGHLAGYDQRDAHEFLHGFLEFLGKDVRQHRERVHQFINLPRPANSIVSELKGIQKDAIKTIFEGTLRSLLLCGKCGSKRVQSEPFMSLSLPLTKEVQEPGSRNGPMSVERCLRHFITPETLADPVDCPTCREKTPTTKQHVVSRLPKVLCLHLKRFDAAHNKKIEEFVEFPVMGLNMGPFLPHWCEVTRGVNTEMDQASVDLPSFLYDLVGTVNHFGTLQSGHYVANVKNDSQWYHCNDAHVSLAGAEGDGSNEVGSSSGAYLLFYIRRWSEHF